MKYAGYILAVLALVLAGYLFIGNRAARMLYDVLEIQMAEVSRQLDAKQKEREILFKKIEVLNDSIIYVNDEIKKKKDRERRIVALYERRLQEVDAMTDYEVDSFLITHYPDSRDIVRDLTAFEECRELLTNKDGTIKLLEARYTLQDQVIRGQDSIIHNLEEQIILKDVFISQLEDQQTVRLKRVRRQRNTAYAVSGGLFILLVTSLAIN